MQQSAATRTMAQARRILKRMEIQGLDWGGVREEGRQAIRRVLEDRMHTLIGNRIAELDLEGVADRRNGSYRRLLLTTLGAVELSVPRACTFSAARVLEAYARRERSVDRRILFAVFTYENQKAGTSSPFLLTQNS